MDYTSISARVIEAGNRFRPCYYTLDAIKHADGLFPESLQSLIDAMQTLGERILHLPETLQLSLYDIGSEAYDRLEEILLEALKSLAEFHTVTGKPNELVKGWEDGSTFVDTQIIDLEQRILQLASNIYDITNIGTFKLADEDNPDPNSHEQPEIQDYFRNLPWRERLLLKVVKFRSLDSGLIMMPLQVCLTLIIS